MRSASILPRSILKNEIVYDKGVFSRRTELPKGLINLQRSMSSPSPCLMIILFVTETEW